MASRNSSRVIACITYGKEVHYGGVLMCWDLNVDIYDVVIGKRALQQLKRLPAYIQFKLQVWIDAVKADGLREVRKIPGFHDEVLKGARQGQRSIRLNKAYRAIYVMDQSGEIHFVEIIEVNKHEY